MSTDPTPDDDNSDLDLSAAFDQLRRILVDRPLNEVLQQVADLAKRTIPLIDEVSVTLIENDKPTTVVFTGDLAATLDERQYEHGFGPCLDAARTGKTIVVDNRVNSDYPEFSDISLKAGVTHSISCGLPVPNRLVGALNMYGKSRDSTFNEESVVVAEAFAAYAATAVANASYYAAQAKLAENLKRAMDSRSLIEQAKGVLMAQRHCDEERAFFIMRRMSSRSNRKIREIAQEIVDSVIQ